MARTYAQLNPLTTQFLINKIPFRTIGHRPLFETVEVQTLFDYIALAASLDQPVTRALQNKLVTIANRPNRFLSRRLLTHLLTQAQQEQQTLAEALLPPKPGVPLQPGSPPVSPGAAQSLLSLLKCLKTIGQALIKGEENPPAGWLLSKTDDAANLNQHYQNFYGPGEKAGNRISNLLQAQNYARFTGLHWIEFQQQIKSLDTTLGLPPEQVIMRSTIHRVKGLEFDYVVIPDCRESAMPVIAKDTDRTRDRAEANSEIAVSQWLEAERRLFYVALTRARHAVYIGAPPLPRPKSAGQPAAPEKNAEKSSRFLEELELSVLYQADAALTKASQGDARLLTQLAQEHPGQHRIINLIKNEYRLQLPPETRKAAAGLKTGRAERAFAYLQPYDSPEGKSLNVGAEALQQPIWGHLVPQQSAFSASSRTNT